MTVKIGVARTTVPAAATGTFDFVDPTIGGETVKAAITLLTSTVDNTGGLVQQCAASIGATDGTDQIHTDFRMRHGVGITRSHRRGNTTRVVQNTTLTADSVDGEATFNSFITNGVRCEVEAGFNTFALPYEAAALMFAGADVQAKTGIFTVTPGTATNVVCGFDPDIVFFFYGDHKYADTLDIWGRNCIGVSKPGTVEHCIMFNDAHNASTAANAMRYSNIDSIMEINNVTGNKGGYGNCTTYPNGFTLTCSASGFNEECGYLALKLDGISTWIGTVDSAVVTGPHQVNGIGFAPQAMAMVLSDLTALDTGTPGIAKGMSFFNSNAQICHYWTNQNGSVPNSSTGMAVSDENAITTYADDKVLSNVAAYTGAHPDGVSFNYTAADTTVRRFLGVAFSEFAATGSVVPIIQANQMVLD